MLSVPRIDTGKLFCKSMCVGVCPLQSGSIRLAKKRRGGFWEEAPASMNGLILQMSLKDGCIIWNSAFQGQLLAAILVQIHGGPPSAFSEPCSSKKCRTCLQAILLWSSLAKQDLSREVQAQLLKSPQTYQVLRTAFKRSILVS